MNEAREKALVEITGIAERHGLGIEEIAAAMRKGGISRPEARASGILARVLGYLGGILMLAGIALFIGMQWDQLGPAVRVLVTLGSGFAVYLFALATIADPRFERVTTPLLLVSALLQPTGLGVALKEYAFGTHLEHGLLFICAVMFIQQFLTFVSRDRSALLFTSLFFGSAGLGVLCDLLDIDFEVTALALGIGLTAVSYVVDRGRHRAVAPFWYFAGSVFFLYGSMALLEDSALEIAFFGLAAGIMYLGTVVRSRTLLFVSVVALTSFTGYYFRDSLANAFGLILLGLLLIGLSAFAMNLNRRYISGPAPKPGP